MNVKEFLEIVKQQAWYNAFKAHVSDQKMERLAKAAIVCTDYDTFIRNAFVWADTKEGMQFWYDAAQDFNDVMTRKIEGPQKFEFVPTEKCIAVAELPKGKTFTPEQIIAFMTLFSDKLECEGLPIKSVKRIGNTLYAYADGDGWECVEK